ncbi:MAG TPA: 16S rRNA (adenine(1518)-N(6)/adenine(1519)-N(6))-dimethyltransferase RsmA [Spirochaetota bacterium]|nr:16S rRNA (adenine(1518)-N(6)/adenine(1519)-N(6))-dimethyltransferase RsmA [Spirochaetota bacterium]HOL55929.1 16S rRNA (adenine(1518)-N(6)/adenine(1519)-N(6))-dimethyltransferase RsmA [Spirochaetota bacterium]HPP03235.1 16S rRNA (adenine(1518)-N(6)/adenine(1519)-N(6))-dimethyltransferase RsmA [Spirochaetota bacterium]
MSFSFYNRGDISLLFKEKGINFQKKFGQNFLIDESIVNKIVSIIDNPFSLPIIEIGCGIGNITNKLIEKYSVLGFEIDREFCKILKENINKNFFLIEGDFIKKFNKDFLKEYLNFNEIIVFGAIPYYIITDIIEKLLISDIKIREIYLIIQKDVLNRIYANTKTKEYGYLTILIKTFSYPETLFEIKRNSFYPVPDVDSVLIKLKIKNDIDFDKKSYSDILKKIFNYRRKTLKTSLKNIGIKEDLIQKFFEENISNLNIRIEELNEEKILSLIKLIMQKKGI